MPIRDRLKHEEDSYVRLDKSSGTIYIMGDITQKVASEFRQHLKILERFKKHSSITVEINSYGGEIEPGLMIADSIDLCSKPVITRATGPVMSMAAVILAAGTIREALPNSIIMVHQGSYSFEGRFSDIESEAKENRRLEKVCNDYLDAKTGQPPGYWERRHEGKNLYLTPEEALSEKLITAIVRRKS